MGVREAVRAGAASVHGLTLAVLAVAVAEALVRHRGTQLLIALAFAVALITPLSLRRRAPIATVVWVVAVMGVASTFPISQDVFVVALVIAAAAAGRHAPAPRTYAVPVTASVVLAVLVVRSGGDLGDVVIVCILFSGVWFLGRSARLRAELRSLLAEREELTERGVRLREREAIAIERARIARELHDVVGHAMSLVTIRVQVVRRRLAVDRPSDAAELEDVEVNARQALVEMRRLLGVLRSEDQALDLAPQPSLDDLAGLVESTRAAGVAVQLDQDPLPERLPAGVALAAYRIVQEALTNALRHSGASRVSVSVRCTGGHLELEITNDGAAAGDQGPGHGLIGMRERVALYGGDVSAGVVPDGGYRVHARLPIPAAVA